MVMPVYLVSMKKIGIGGLGKCLYRVLHIEGDIWNGKKTEVFDEEQDQYRITLQGTLSPIASTGKDAVA